MRWLTSFVVSFLIWYLISWPYDFAARAMDWQIFIAGAALSAAAAFLFAKVFTMHPGKLLRSARWLWLLAYIPVFFWYMLLANLDVVYRVLHPRLPIRPGIVKVKTRLTSESGRTTLANSITLTPGTMTVDITDDGYLYIHWINVTATDVEEASRRIVAQFERYLSKIFD